MPNTDTMTLYQQVVMACWAVVVFYWIVAAWSTKRSVERQSPGGRLLVLIVIAVAVDWLLGGSGIHWPAVPIPMPHTPLAGWIGTALCIAGMGFTLWARRTLGANWSGWITFKENHELIQRGPYRIVRHPIYTGALVMVAGSVLAFAAPQPVVGFAVVFVALLVKSRQEEAMMTKHFPDQYPEYRKRVKGLIPFVF